MPPAYHLRPNKVIDRLLLIELLSAIRGENGLKGYAYFGLGGPFLEDMRVIAQNFPSMEMTSLESKASVYARQGRHRCAKNLKLVNQTVGTFLDGFERADASVIWLDYTRFDPVKFTEFELALKKVSDGSIVKITMRANVDDVHPQKQRGDRTSEEIAKLSAEFTAAFKKKFDSLLPSEPKDQDFRAANFPLLVQGMLQIASQRAVPGRTGLVFQLLHSCVYDDGTQMLSVTGVVCKGEDRSKWRDLFSDWGPRNFDWAPPTRIDMPVLSLRERQLLEAHLPDDGATGESLRSLLGYELEDVDTVRVLKNYAEYHRYYPQFAKVSIT